MSLLKLSNIFNLIAQQSKLNSELQGYHLGTGIDEINGNAENNFNPSNQDGNKFPFLLCTLPDGNWLPSESPNKNYVCDLYFYDLQWRDNDSISSIREETDLVKMSKLEAIANNFVENLWRVGMLGIDDFYFSLGTVEFSTGTNLQNNRLLCFNARFTISPASYLCRTWSFDTALIPADYDTADLGVVDFETIIPA